MMKSQELEERKALDDFVQELPIEVQHGFLRADQLHILPDRYSYVRDGRPANMHGLGEGIDLMEMHVTDVRHEAVTHTYKTDFGDREDPLGSTTVSAYKMVAQRSSGRVTRSDSA